MRDASEESESQRQVDRGDKVLELGERTGPKGRDVSSFSSEVLGGSRRIVEFQRGKRLLKAPTRC